MIRVLSVTSTALVFALGAVSCHSPSGPVTPTPVTTPQSKVTITPDLTTFLSLPDRPNAQVIEHTVDGLLKYQFQLQNKSDQNFALSYTTTFVDSKGAVADQQRPRRIFFKPYEIQTVVVTCSNRDGADVQVQVAAAN